MARLSRQAGEEGSERRRVEIEKREMQEKLQNSAAELEKTKQNLVNSEAKVYSSCIIFVSSVISLEGPKYCLVLDVVCLLIP